MTWNITIHYMTPDRKYFAFPVSDGFYVGHANGGGAYPVGVGTFPTLAKALTAAEDHAAAGDTTVIPALATVRTVAEPPYCEARR